MPEVSVLMPVYNAEKHLFKAVESILNQTFSDFEFLILDDCSTDSSPAVLDRYDDPRIVRHRNEHNLGITLTLNRGLELARGTYIARMDGDDIAFPDRLRQQVAYMNANPDVALLGTRYVHIDDDGEYLFGGQPAPPPPEPGTRGYVRWSLLWMTSIQHPTAMLRRSVLEAHGLRYDRAFETAEDYELWTRISRAGEVERLDDTGLYYRTNPQGISQQRRDHQLETHYAITRREISALLGSPPPDDLLRFAFRLVLPVKLDVTPGVDVVGALRLYLRIRDTFLASRVLGKSERAQIDWLTERVLLKAMDYCRLFGDSSTRQQVRLLMLRAAPALFTRIAGEFIYYRLFKRGQLL